MWIGFYGAAGTVTGSKHLLKLDSGTQILLDCGMFQGAGDEVDKWNAHFGFPPHEVDYLILSHAHIDHCGLIPKFIKEGFTGTIYATPATIDLCDIMLRDSARIQESDAEYENKKRAELGKKPIEPLYTEQDAVDALAYFRPVPYNTPFEVTDEVELTFTDAGHIIGSACVNLKVKEENNEQSLTFTGDVGRYGGRILRDPQPFPQADVLICESTYGDRFHDENQNVEAQLLKIVEETCVAKRGRLIIPAFSVGRTQEIVNVLNNLEHEGHLPPIKVFVDSPLSTNATQIMRRHPECFNEDIREYMKNDPTPFGFDKLKYIRRVEESIALNDMDEPCIIISASGMMEAGRIRHHVRNNIEDPRNTILIVGWCTPSSLGGKLRAGDKKVSIFGRMYDVNADVEIIDAYSAHGDQSEMLRLLECQDPEKVKQLFLVHGEPEVVQVWKQKLHETGFKNIEVPAFKAGYKL